MMQILFDFEYFLSSQFYSDVKLSQVLITEIITNQKKMTPLG